MVHTMTFYQRNCLGIIPRTVGNIRSPWSSWISIASKQFLEVGCGDGHFLSLARTRGYEGHASELNPNSLERLRTSGFEVLTDLGQGLRGRQYDALIMSKCLSIFLILFHS